MTTHRFSSRKARLAGAGVLAAVLLAGCSGLGGHRVDESASKAEEALTRGQVDKAIVLAEKAVQASPRDAARRALLGHAYLKAGRFDSAATSFDDAMELGDNSGRTALSLSLALIGGGHNADAIAVLEDWRDAIPASDLGLAMALAGETGRGVAILGDALRTGKASPKLRQNLAYAYALDGRWRDARIMASMDLPADQIDARLTAWAAKSRPEVGRERVAAMLNTPLPNDPGQPAALALSNAPSAEQLAAEAGALNAEPKRAAAELPPVDAPVQPAVAAAYVAPAAAPVVTAAPASVRRDFASAFTVSTAPKPVAQRPVQRVQVRAVAPVAPRQPSSVVAPRANGPATHMVQLGSFASQQGARRAWGIYAARNPELKNTRMTITSAMVRGKQYWRVAAGGLDTARASGLCSSVRHRGGACFAYAAPTVRTMPAGVPQRDAGGPVRARRR